NGSEFVLVDPARSTRNPAFDHAKLATALSAATSTRYEAFKLPFQQIDFLENGKLVAFNLEGRRWGCDVQGAQCKAMAESTGDREAGRRGGQRGGVAANSMATSPDNKRIAFIRDYNLWVREIATRKETQLTTDGVKDFGYATNNAGWTKSD